MQSSRRFFITGWNKAETSNAFAERLSRAADGVLEPLTQGPSRQWLFIPADAGDVALARALCAEYEVELCLRVGAPLDAGTDEITSQRLIVDPTRLDVLQQLGDPHMPLWRAQAGCRLGTLAEAGLTQFAGLAPDTTLAEWAARPHHAVPPGRTATTGVLGADILFADGTTETLGGFGVDDARPLRTAGVQAAVPALFQLMQTHDAQRLHALAQWLGDVRLDALAPVDNAGKPEAHTNLAQLFLGTGGRYGWVMQWLLAPAAPIPGRSCDPSGDQAASDADIAQALALNQAVASILDPSHLYGGATFIA